MVGVENFLANRVALSIKEMFASENIKVNFTAERLRKKLGHARMFILQSLYIRTERDVSPIYGGIDDAVPILSE